MRKWILLSLLLAGCSQGGQQNGGDTKFLLPWPDVNGNYTLQEVTIETLSNPTELRGEAAEVYSQATFSSGGFKDTIARPRVTKSGDVYIPQDAESATAIAVYAQFDKLLKYEKQLGTRSQLNWPRKVSIQLNLSGSEINIHDNAHYFMAYDVIGLVPYTKSGVPVALNQGIVAHEHFHAHFQSQVMNPLNLMTDSVVSALEDIFYPLFSWGALPAAGGSKMGTQSPRMLNNIVLRGWNEGLADLFASIYTGKSEFFSPSLPGPIAKIRDLDAAAGPLLSGESFEKYFGKAALPDEQMARIAYGQGTALARLLYGLAHTGQESPQKFLARILERIGKIPAQVSANFSKETLDFDAITAILLEGYELNAQGCKALGDSVQKVTMDRSFAKCAL